jgi:bisphosphoglycerate-independent phosphoglycerate mutase (AlkP superfamily)
MIAARRNRSPNGAMKDKDRLLPIPATFSAVRHRQLKQLFLREEFHATPDQKLAHHCVEPA